MIISPVFWLHIRKNHAKIQSVIVISGAVNCLSNRDDAWNRADRERKRFRKQALIPSLTPPGLRAISRGDEGAKVSIPIPINEVRS